MWASGIPFVGPVKAIETWCMILPLLNSLENIHFMLIAVTLLEFLFYGFLKFP